MIVTNDQKLAFKVAEAAELLSMSRSMLYALIQSGKISTIKIGKSRRITRSQLEEFIEREEFSE